MATRRQPRPSHAQTSRTSGGIPLKGNSSNDESWVEFTFLLARVSQPLETTELWEGYAQRFRKTFASTPTWTASGPGTASPRANTVAGSCCATASTRSSPPARPVARASAASSLRIPTRLLVNYDAFAGLEGVLSNLSRTGCFINTDLPAPVGTRLDLRLNDQTHGEALELPAEVVSIDIRHDGKAAGQRGMGLRFLDLSAEAQKKLDEIYSSLAAAA